MPVFFKRLNSGQKGFTLIELLVVVAILGTVSAVAMPNVLGFIGEGKVEAAMAERHNLQIAITAYYFNEREMPDDITEVSAYLINTPQFAWTIEDGAIAPGTGNPLAGA
ncbi:type II secretion system protein [Dehalogenimonas sp. THU2]|uniref:type IV pilin protein n=1 Tax=Dehalogenimonas sp. THU2 TaxID=3151121 RepID=UPI0032188FA7